MMGFFFANRHSRDFNIYGQHRAAYGLQHRAAVAMEDTARGLLPSVRRNDYTISGRHGTVDFGGTTYNTRQITVDIAFIGADEQTLQRLARDIAAWLSGKGLLHFDDEPDRAYEAVVYDAVDTDQLIRAKRAAVTFECQPFAKTIHFRQSTGRNIASGHTINITSHGTQPTSGKIIIQNAGVVNINNITIKRRAQSL